MARVGWVRGGVEAGVEGEGVRRVESARTVTHRDCEASGRRLPTPTPTPTPSPNPDLS